MERAAAMGNARAMAELSYSCSPVERLFQLAWRSTELGDAKGTYCLMQCFRDGIGCKTDDVLAEELMERAVDLGSVSAVNES